MLLSTYQFPLRKRILRDLCGLSTVSEPIQRTAHIRTKDCMAPITIASNAIFRVNNSHLKAHNNLLIKMGLVNKKKFIHNLPSPC